MPNSRLVRNKIPAMASQKSFMIYISVVCFVLASCQLAELPQRPARLMSVEEQAALLKQYCQGCQNDQLKFDNIADIQTLSASMMQGYLRAAAHVTTEALGDPNAEPSSTVYRANVLASQLRHVPGTPMGTRGGLSFVFNFPADAEYNIRLLMWPEDEGR